MVFVGSPGSSLSGFQNKSGLVRVCILLSDQSCRYTESSANHILSLFKVISDWYCNQSCQPVIVLLHCVYLTACLLTNEASEPQEKSLHATWVIWQTWEKLNVKVLGLKLEHGHYGCNEIAYLCNMSVNWFWSWAPEGSSLTTLMTNS